MDVIDSETALANDNSSLLATCSFCQRVLSSDNETGDLESISICGDCKFLFLEDLEPATPDIYRRRTPTSRRRRRGSSESIESLFSHQFSQMIAAARQNQPMLTDQDNQSLDVDARSVQRTSSRTTPTGSRRWRRMLSDSESDGLDSFYGESESNISIRRYRLFPGDGDASTYGGDSDASLDGHSIIENENYARVGGLSDLESDTDIDPMNAGIHRWNLDDQEDDDDEESDWEEADVEETIVDSLRARSQLHRLVRSNRINRHLNLRSRVVSTDSDYTFPLNFRARARSGDILRDPEELERQNYHGNSRDFLDDREFQTLLENLAETDGSRRGAPPASLSFLMKIPRVIVNEDHLKKLDGLACAICKDSLNVGTVVNELPCLHLYHPSCIFPWLRARNTCPLCRYELPTDDKDYEDMKRRRARGNEMVHIQDHDVNEDSSSDTSDDASLQNHHDRADQGERVDANSDGGGRPRNRWFSFASAAAPIVGIIGFSLLLWMSKPSSTYRSTLSDCAPYRRETNRCRRWWSFF